MRIIRTCSNVNVRDLEQRIDNTELEKKFIECIAEAYEKLYCKELGTYEAVSEQLPTAYSVQYMPGLNNQQQISKQVFEEITRE